MAIASEERAAAASETLPWALLRSLAYALTAAAFVWPLAEVTVAISTALGAFAASFFGAVTARRLRFRTLIFPLIACVGVATTLIASRLLGASVSFALSEGPSRAAFLRDDLLFSFGAAFIAFGLRGLAFRRKIFSIVEVVLIATSFATLVAAHRNGAINRPFEIADPIIVRGGDPTSVLLLFGVAALVLIVIVLLSEKSILRSLFHLAIVALLLLLVLQTTSMLGLPTPPPPKDGLGLRGDKEPQKQGENGNGRGGKPPPRSNDELQFRDDYDSPQNQAPVAVVLLHNDYSPPTGEYYFRQSAFSQFNGQRLIAATRGDVDRDLAQNFPTSDTDVAEPPPDTFGRTVVDTTVALMADHPHPFALTSPLSMAPAGNPDTTRFRRVYRVKSRALVAHYEEMLGLIAGSSSWSDDVRAYYTKGPTDPRYDALAKQIISALPPHLATDPLARALAITDWLSTEGTYSLKSHHAGAEDPTADFLFGDKTGYCVHFAHAAVYLMRAVGVPSRVATGYAIDESARQGGSTILVTGDRSHAWPEIYLEGYGWVVTDVSPQRTLGPTPPPPDPDLQRLLGELARGEAPLPQDGSAPPARIDVLARNALNFVGRASLITLIFAFAVFYGVKTWRRIAPWFTRGAHVQRALYRRELDRLAEIGWVRNEGESREAFAARVAAAIPSFVPLTYAHLGARFGGGDGEVIARETVTRIRAERAKVAPLWRRALGVVEPWSWLRAR